MDWTWLDRLGTEIHRTRDELRARTGRALALLLAVVAILQFSVLGTGFYKENPARFLGFVVWAGSFYWAIVPLVTLAILARWNTHRQGLYRLNHLLRRHLLLVGVGWQALVGLTVASAALVSSNAPQGFWWLIGAMFLIEVGTILLFSFLRNVGRATWALLPRLLAAALLVQWGSKLNPGSVTNYEKVTELWPVLAVALALHFAIWNLSAAARLQGTANALGRLRKDILESKEGQGEIESRYLEIHRAGLTDDAPPGAFAFELKEPAQDEQID